MIRRPPSSPLFPTPTLSRPPAGGSFDVARRLTDRNQPLRGRTADGNLRDRFLSCLHARTVKPGSNPPQQRSEEHTSELQSRLHLVCRLLLEKKKKIETA